MIIDPAKSICTVIVTVEAEGAEMEFVVDHASEGLALFSDFDGFIAGATHVSEDGEKVVQYLQWESSEAHAACMNDPEWAQHPSSRRFMQLMEAGDILVDVRLYDIAAMED